MPGDNWNDMDPKKLEDHRSDRLLSDFLGLKDNELCPVFGFDRNTYYLLAFQVIVSFLVFKLCLMISDYLPRQEDEKRDSDATAPMDTAPPGRLEPVQEEPLPLEPSPRERQESVASGSGRDLSLEDQPFTSAIHAAGRSRPQTHLSSSMADDEPRAALHGEDREIQALNEEFQQRLGRILEERRQKELMERQQAAEAAEAAAAAAAVPSKEPSEQLSLSRMEEGDTLPPLQVDVPEPADIPIVPIVYWVWQIIMAIILLCAMVFSMTRGNSKWTTLMQSRGTWSHYNLFIFAYINSGMLPTAVQAIFYMAANMPALSNGSYTSLHSDDSRLLEAGPGERTEQEELNEVNKRLFTMLLPVVLPLVAAGLTHMVPFCFCYPWVVMLTAVLTVGLIWLARFLSALLKTTLKVESDAINLVLQIIACLFAHSCVPVMTRVYGGEWRHGGYSNQLFSRVFHGEFEHVECTWFSFSHGVDAVLRWT